jgi:glycosyltransferase involved in cell wall biosynthesis
VVVAAGRLNPQKGFDLLIPAFARVAERHPDWRLRIYGGGPERARLRRMVLDHGLYDHVFLMGPTRRLAQAMTEASLFVLSSRFEGFGMVILEAMSKGLPVVSFDCPTGPAEIVASDHNGLLVPDGDIAAMTSALLVVIGNDELRSRLAKGALDTSKRYDGEVVAAAWTELLDSLLGQPPVGQPAGR